MNDVGFGELVVRMLISLAIVLGMVLGAYALMRRRQGLAPAPRAGRVSRIALPGRAGRTPGAMRTSRTGSTRRGLRVLGRVGIGRTTQVVAIQFAEKVYMLGTSEQGAPAVLAELDLDAWLAATESPDDDLVGGGPGVGPGTRLGAGTGAPSRVAPAPRRPSGKGFLDQLREATTRRG